MDDPAIRTDALTKRYGDHLAVDGLDLTVGRGEVFGLLGPNGAGKTTTVLMLLGLSEPSSGSARVVGLDPTREPLAVKRRVGYLPDAVGFYPKLTGRENLRYVAALNGLGPEAAEDRIERVLVQVGLRGAADRLAGGYSRGMMQRLGIADALVKDPEILILDEPTIAIDPSGVSRVLELIRSLRDTSGVTVLLSSHLLHQVQEVCDRVGIFVHGRLVATGTVDELGRQLTRGHVYVEVEVAEGGDAAADHVAQVPGVVEVGREDGRIVAATEGDRRREIAERLTERGLTVVGLSVRGTHLDQIYRRYFGEDADDRR